LTPGEHEPEKPAAWCTIATDAVVVRVVARPGSTRRGLMRVDPRGLVVGLHSPPDKGRANEELIELLARLLRVPRTAITLIRGDTARTKTVRIASSRPREVAGTLQALVPGSA
jgi:uncharacterized protein